MWGGQREERSDLEWVEAVVIYGTATQATTGSLVVVGVTSLAGAATAYRAGSVLLARGVAFGVVAIGVATLLVFSRSPQPVRAASASGESLMRAVDEREEGEDVEWQIEMKLIDRQGQTRTRTAKLFRKKFVQDGRRQDRQAVAVLRPPVDSPAV